MSIIANTLVARMRRGWLILTKSARVVVVLQGQYLVSSGQDKGVIVWDFHTGQVRRSGAVTRPPDPSCRVDQVPSDPIA
jgi:hypothetical protein